jgi:hypothetical protein
MCGQTTPASNGYFKNNQGGAFYGTEETGKLTDFLNKTPENLGCFSLGFLG